MEAESIPVASQKGLGVGVSVQDHAHIPWREGLSSSHRCTNRQESADGTGDTRRKPTWRKEPKRGASAQRA